MEKIGKDEYIKAIKQNYLLLADVRAKQEEVAEELNAQIREEFGDQVGKWAENAFREYTNNYLTTVGYDDDFNKFFFERWKSSGLDPAPKDDPLESLTSEYVRESMEESISEICGKEAEGHQYYKKALDLIDRFYSSQVFYDSEVSPYVSGFKEAYMELCLKGPNDPRIKLIETDGGKLSHGMPFDELRAKAEERRNGSFEIIDVTNVETVTNVGTSSWISPFDTDYHITAKNHNTGESFEFSINAYRIQRPEIGMDFTGYEQFNDWINGEEIIYKPVIDTVIPDDHQIEIIGVIYNPENMKNVGCNNGNYPSYVILAKDLENGNLGNGAIEKICGTTCGCGRGCANNDALPDVGAVFTNKEALYAFQSGKEYFASLKSVDLTSQNSQDRQNRQNSQNGPSSQDKPQNSKGVKR